MPNAILDGLSLVDTTGHVILGATLVSLVLGICANGVLRARYASIERDLRESTGPTQPFSHRVLSCIVRDAQDAVRGSREVNTQGIIEDNFQAELKPLLLAERFVKASTGLVIILGLLGTFYGLTLSIGRLVHLVSADVGGVSAGVADVSQTLTTGLTQALTGMAIAFSNSLLGIVSAVILTVIGVFSNVTDRRMALMIQVETYLDRWFPSRGASRGDGGANIETSVARFGESVARLDSAVARFEGALQAFAANTKDLREFDVHVALTKPRG